MGTTLINVLWKLFSITAVVPCTRNVNGKANETVKVPALGKSAFHLWGSSPIVVRSSECSTYDGKIRTV